MDERPAPDAGLCGACGLCCNGSMFVRGAIAPEEEPAARRLSLTVLKEDGEVSIGLPCPAHRGDHCSIYADRPRVCRNYRCLLLRRYEAGEIGRDEALTLVGEARRRFAALRALVGAVDASTTDLWAIVDAHIASKGAFADTVAWRRAHQAALLEVAVIQTFMSRYFQADLWKISARSQDEPLERGA